jgi:16S rRNA (guanine(966)-N(2))-methyltransferase RsmD
VRIISGTAKGRKLKQFKGQRIRPTGDRVREAVFSSLQSRFGTFEGLKILDLFAGTGALGIEALSRGAAKAVLVDQSPQAADIIADNIRSCGMAERADFFRASADKIFDRLVRYAPFDIIFLDPPYNQGLIGPALRGIIGNSLLSEKGVVCVESAHDEQVPVDVLEVVTMNRKEYGATVVTFLSLSIPEATSR